MWKGIAVLGAAGAVAGGVLAGCGGSDSSAPAEKVSFTSPAAGSTVSGPVTAQVAIEGFTLNGDSVGQAAKQGEGHLHFSLDGGKYDFPKYSGANGALAAKLGVAGKYSPSVTPGITYANLPAGPHTLKVFLANNDHSDTGVSAEVAFTVKASPSAAFLSPKEGATVGRTVTAKVALTDFAIDAAAVGQAAKDGEGHLHFSLDGGKYDFPKYSGANGQLAQKLGIAGKYSPSVTPSITYANLPPGKHILKVFLANNDHSDTGAGATVSFVVR